MVVIVRRDRLPWGNIRTAILDVAIALVITVFDLFVSWGQSRTTDVALWVIPAYALLIFPPLAVRRRWPSVVFVLVWVHSVIANLIFAAFLPILGVWLALYTVAAYCARRSAVLALLATMVTVTFNVTDAVARQDPQDRIDALIGTTLILTLLSLVIFGAGRWTLWSIRQRQIVAERSAAEAIAAERSRIARDLHDVVASSVSSINLQAAIAERVIRTDPDQAVAIMAQIGATARQAIVELQWMLDPLRGPDEVFVPDELRPGLAAVPSLLKRFRSGGMEVLHETSGRPDQLPTELDVSAYRILQEALTNASRYGDRTAPVLLRIDWHQRAVKLLVRNQLASERNAQAMELSTGHGLLGIGERVSSVGGHLRAGVENTDAWLIEAELPTFAHVEDTPIAIKRLEKAALR